jgi:predicted RNA polymerase sigma factor
MKLDASVTIRDRIDDLYRSDSRRVFASLVRLLKDFDLADDAMHEAYAAAVEIWQRDGVPANPRAWLISKSNSRRQYLLRNVWATDFWRNSGDRCRLARFSFDYW